MAKACVTNEYFSGQGALLLGDRNATTGKPEGLRPVGNVSALNLGIETSTFQHKESCSGVRGVDLEISQELSASMAMTLESLNKENMAIALYGTASVIAGASVTDESVNGWHDMWSPLEYIKVSSVVVTDNTNVTTYVEGTDYEVNLEAGTIKVLSTGSITDGQELYVDYTYATQDAIEAATSGSAPIKYARFEGLNTADADKEVIVDIFKLSIQPLAELALIQDELAGMEVEAKILSDELRSVGSKYFRVRKIA